MSNFWQVKDIIIQVQKRAICEGELSQQVLDSFAVRIGDLYKNNPQLSSVSNDDLLSELERRIKKE